MLLLFVRFPLLDGSLFLPFPTVWLVLKLRLAHSMLQNNQPISLDRMLAPLPSPTAPPLQVPYITRSTRPLFHLYPLSYTQSLVLLGGTEPDLVAFLSALQFQGVP